MGSMRGQCRFYAVQARGEKGLGLELSTQVEVKNTSRGARARKITGAVGGLAKETCTHMPSAAVWPDLLLCLSPGLEVLPGESCVPRLLVSSNDSRVRLFEGYAQRAKFKGHRNLNSQIRASASPGESGCAAGPLPDQRASADGRSSDYYCAADGRGRSRARFAWAEARHSQQHRLPHGQAPQCHCPYTSLRSLSRRRQVRPVGVGRREGHAVAHSVGAGQRGRAGARPARQAIRLREFPVSAEQWPHGCTATCDALRSTAALVSSTTRATPRALDETALIAIFAPERCRHVVAALHRALASSTASTTPEMGHSPKDSAKARNTSTAGRVRDDHRCWYRRHGRWLATLCRRAMCSGSRPAPPSRPSAPWCRGATRAGR